MTVPAFSVRDLRVGYSSRRGVTQVLHGVSMDIAPGEIVGMVGESGSGKSTTPSAALGLVTENAIVTGSVEMAGQPIRLGRAKETRQDARGKASVIFQQPMRAFSPYDRLDRQITDAIMAQIGVSRAEAHQKALDGFTELKLPDPALALRKYPHQMSGGQLQRAMIALAFACKPQVLICDEPTTALDVTVQAQVIHMIRTLAEERGVGVLFITHDLGVVAEICDRVYVMYSGQIVEENTVNAVLKQPRHRYTRALLNSTPVMGEKTRFQTIPGNAPGAGEIKVGCPFAPRCQATNDLCTTEFPALQHQAEGSFACHNPEPLETV
ncbi:MAG: ABC transporter ATP-binding protein [Paracoccaceae bacterium]